MDDVASLWRMPDGSRKAPAFRQDPVNFRSFDDANQLIKSKLPIISGRYHLIVGIPRSGLLFANLIALHLNLRLLSLDQIGRLDPRKVFLPRTAGDIADSPDVSRPLQVLVVDDSTNTGASINHAREIISKISVLGGVKADYLAVYGTTHVKNHVDFCLEIVEQPRVFEWNFLHHAYTQNFLFDMDGVLCEDGQGESSDSPELYIRHLMHARPKIIPTQPIGAVVTSRLEKYRSLTEDWLRRHHVVYKYLIMVDLPSAEERRRLAVHANFKADVYKTVGGQCFVESETWQAKEIARITGRAVYNLQTSELIPTVSNSMAAVASAG